MLKTVEVETGEPLRGSVIWMHGLGADGHDFEPVVPLLAVPELGLRFVFPHAPVRPVTLNAGMQMPAWFDVLALDRKSAEDEAGIRGSEAEVRELIRRENERGVPTSAIVLAGFSQGGAMAIHTALRYPERLAGVIALSTYVTLQDKLDAELAPANRALPVFMAHGTRDPLVTIQFGRDSRSLLERLGYDVEWKTYEMEHAVCEPEIADIRRWFEETAYASG